MPCNICNTDKTEDEFHLLKKRGKILRQHRCKTCQQAYHKSHYAANKDKYIKKAKTWKLKTQQDNFKKLIKYYETHGCVDCGENHPFLLDFDHTDASNKAENVSVLLSNSSWEKVQKEIDKCVVRCLKCHRKRTIVQLGWYKYIEENVLKKYLENM